MKIKLILLMMAMSLIWTGCASQKKLDSGDEFSVDDTANSSGKPSDDLSLDGPAATKSSSDDLSLDEPSGKSASSSKSDASDMDAALENELNSLDNGAAPQPAEKDASNELSLDEPSSAIAQNNPPPAAPAPEVAPPPEVAVAPEVVPPVPEQSPTEPSAPAASGAPVTINNVQYKGNNNGGAVTITADQPPQFTTRFNSITNQFIVEVQNSTIPKKLTRTLNTKDMASSIGSVDIYQKSGSNVARFVVQLRPGSSEPIVQPEGNSLLIIGASISGSTNQPSTSVADSGSGSDSMAASSPTADGDSFVISKAETEESTRKSKGGVLDYQNLEEFLMGEQQFSGKKISLETSGIKVTDAISFLAEESGANIVMDDSVAAANSIVNIRLKNVPWDQALVMILKAKKLVYKRQGNVLLITSLDALKKEEEEAITLRESRKLQEPLIVKRFFIAYADIGELKNQVEEYMKSLPVVKPAIGSPAATINKVITDKRNNSLIVTETEANLKNIEQIIKAIDTQPKQVLIESKIIVADETFTRSLGIKWNATGGSGSPNAVIAIDPTKVSGVGTQQSSITSDISWGQIDFLGSLTSTLNFGEQQRVLKVLASPSITVLSNVPATITKTTDVQIFQTQTSTNPQTGAPITTITPSLIPVGMTLSVTPIVTNENTVYMKLDLTRSTKAPVDAGQTKSNAKTEMFVKSGLTAVVGGIYESSQDDNMAGVPGLRQIPVLGKLFEASDKTTSKNELMMFITPTILKPL